jgi:putative FmdB family regulatory protein
MPTYEYECSQCGLRFEQFQKITDDPVRICPQCQGPVQRLLNPEGGIIFKRSGPGPRDRRRAGAGPGHCGQGPTCCGRDSRCEKPPCGD